MFMKRPKRTKLLAAFGVAAMLLAACGGDDAADEPAAETTVDTATEDAAATTAPAVTTAPASDDDTADDQVVITVWAPLGAEEMMAVAPLYEEETGIKVDVIVKDFSSGFQEYEDIQPTGNGPDMLVLAHNQLGVYVKSGFLTPIELGAAEAEFNPTAVTAITYEGQKWFVPFTVENVGLFRNADLVPDPVTSWDEMVQISQDLVDAGEADERLLFGIDQTGGDAYHFYGLQTSYGVPIYGDDGTGSFDPANVLPTDEKGLVFAEALAEWGATGLINPNVTYDIATELFNSGRAPFWVTGPWAVANMEEAGTNYVIDPIPSAGGETARPYAGIVGVGLNPDGPNLLAAQDFATNFLTREDVQYMMYQAGARPPAHSGALAQAAAEDANIAAFGAIGEVAQPMPAFPCYGEVYTLWSPTQLQILRGDVEPSAWTDMTAKAREIMAGDC
jgi:arabinogalactan oligomer/maltooligosaccharide transport system substrate-binding protein